MPTSVPLFLPSWHVGTGVRCYNFFCFGDFRPAQGGSVPLATGVWGGLRTTQNWHGPGAHHVSGSAQGCQPSPGLLQAPGRGGTSGTDSIRPQSVNFSGLGAGLFLVRESLHRCTRCMQCMQRVQCSAMIGYSLFGTRCIVALIACIAIACIACNESNAVQ